MESRAFHGLGMARLMLTANTMRYLPILPFLIATLHCAAADSPSAPAPATRVVAPASTVVHETRSFEGTTNGCGNVFVIRRAVDNRSALIVSLDRSKAHLTQPGMTTVDLTTLEGAARIVALSGAPDDTHFLPFCTDQITDQDIQVTAEWKASKGSVSVRLGVPDTSGLYEVNVEGTDLEFRNATGDTITVPSAELRAMVGWLPG